MTYYLRCQCGATAVAHGEDDPDTNATEIDDIDEWEGGVWTCPHEEYEITGSGYPEPLEGDV